MLGHCPISAAPISAIPAAVVPPVTASGGATPPPFWPPLSAAKIKKPRRKKLWYTGTATGVGVAFGELSFLVGFDAVARGGSSSEARFTLRGSPQLRGIARGGCATDIGPWMAKRYVHTATDRWAEDDEEVIAAFLEHISR